MRRLCAALLFLLLTASAASAATYMPLGTGNFTAVGTWRQVMGAPSCTATVTPWLCCTGSGTGCAAVELDIETGTTALVAGASYAYSATFTISNNAVGSIAVKVGAWTTGTGTLDLILANNTSAGTRECSGSITATNLDVNGNGWVQLACSATPNGTDVYKIGAKLSSGASATMSLQRGSAGDWAHLIGLTTSPASLAAGDKFHMAGLWSSDSLTSYTITQDGTATTSWGPTVSSGPPQGMTVSKGATFVFGTSASTAYYLKLKGILAVYGGGEFNMGKLPASGCVSPGVGPDGSLWPCCTGAGTGCSGTRMPSTSSGVLEFDSVANVDSGLNCFPGSICYGAANTVTPTQTTLTADVAASGTSLTVDNTAGMVANDNIVVASTSRTPGDSQAIAITTVVNGTTLTVPTITVAHCGVTASTCPYPAEVGLLSHNVKIRGISTTSQGYAICQTTAGCSFDGVEFYQLGSATASKRGINLNCTTGACSITNGSIHDFRSLNSIGIQTVGAAMNNIVVSKNVFFNNAQNSINVGQLTTGTALTFNGNLAITASTEANQGGFSFSDYGGVITNNTVVGSNARGFTLSEADTAGQVGTFENNIAHSNGTIGFDLGFLSTTPLGNSTVSSLTAWRNGSVGIQIVGRSTRLLGTNVSIGNVSGLSFMTPSVNTLVSGLIENSDATFTTTNGILFSGATSTYVDLVIENSSFGHTTGNTQDINVSTAGSYVNLTLRNSSLDSSTILTGQANLMPGTKGGGSFICGQRLGLAGASGVGVHRCIFGSSTAAAATCGQSQCSNGQVDIDTGTFKTAAPSVKCTPNNANVRLICDCKDIAVASGNTVTPTVYVNKAGGYDGAQPRLVLIRNAPLGVTEATASTPLATASGGTGSWLTLTGTTPAASGDDGIFRVCVDGGGGGWTQGSFYVDDWSVP